ncbi:MAG: site-specific DNA-methyltransferase [Anaerolineales bacterium]
MERTKTSSFGTGKRESHDSSSFYNRNMYEGLFSLPLSKKELNSIIVPPAEGWANKIYCQSSENINIIPDNSIALAFTSPPYNVGKEYDDNVSLKEYLRLIENVACEVYRVLRPGGRYVVNVANLGRKPYIPLHAFFYDIHMRVGFLPMGEIIWQKAKGSNGNCAWGSWRSAKAPRLRDIHEYLLVFAKQSFNRPDSGDSGISATEFMDATLSIWEIPPESAKRVRHPAPFPVELAKRVIELFSYEGDVVLDPFVGSGSTCVAASINNRKYVGFDISEEYCNLAKLRIENKGKLYMPTEKTECSELSVAFGVLGIKHPLMLSSDQVKRLFEDTLSQEKYNRFKIEFKNPPNTKLYARLYELGKMLREKHSLFTSVESLKWLGPQKMARVGSGAQDLLVANTPISIKAESNVVFNFSPSHIFTSIPQGLPPADRSENWYLIAAPADFQSLYSGIRDIRLSHFPESIEEFEKEALKDDRKELQDEINKLSSEAKSKFETNYINLCHNVARYSADKFNGYYHQSMNGSSRNSVIQHIVRFLFRIESIEYIFAGTTGKTYYGVKIPSLHQWIKEWKILDIEAVPDFHRKQSVVNLFVNYKNKTLGGLYTAKFHIEIRWSHGKFCGSPEAKLYKDFRWTDIVFVNPII